LLHAPGAPLVFQGDVREITFGHQETARLISPDHPGFARATLVRPRIVAKMRRTSAWLPIVPAYPLCDFRCLSPG
jgi:hypothetical protein